MTEEERKKRIQESTVLDALATANDANQSAHVNVVEGDDEVDQAIDLMREANHMAIALLNEL